MMCVFCVYSLIHVRQLNSAHPTNSTHPVYLYDSTKWPDSCFLPFCVNSSLYKYDNFPTIAVLSYRLIMICYHFWYEKRARMALNRKVSFSFLVMITFLFVIQNISEKNWNIILKFFFLLSPLLFSFYFLSFLSPTILHPQNIFFISSISFSSRRKTKLWKSYKIWKMNETHATKTNLGWHVGCFCHIFKIIKSAWKIVCLIDMDQFLLPQQPDILITGHRVQSCHPSPVELLI